MLHQHTYPHAADDASTTIHEKPIEKTASSYNIAILRSKKLGVVFTAMLLLQMLIALDQTILATTLPRIASVGAPQNSSRKIRPASRVRDLSASLIPLSFAPSAMLDRRRDRRHCSLRLWT
ncbi:hypothetical protein R3P38DRAFT_2901896 [Favolaschia claudopus]|uniref:Uncharacterized protein n=1 Tax=Favolaschia claudopus TaxID=2862362 RepID=A0AAW0CLR9_9AGAR